MNKITSNFYLIRICGKPSYVGYTNRPIETRFKEHLRDKDFGDEDVSIENLGNLEYDFTWDINIINSYAKEVSDRETALILFHGTQDSIWQKGLGSNLGGQTWNNVKNFVKTNQENPLFVDIDNSSIVELLEWQHKNYRKLRGLVDHTNVNGISKTRHVVSHTSINGSIKLRGVINYTSIKDSQKLRNVISATSVRRDKKLRNTVYNTSIKGYSDIKHMVNDTYLKSHKKLKNINGSTYIKGRQRLNDIINHTQIKGSQKIRSMVSNTKRHRTSLFYILRRKDENKME